MRIVRFLCVVLTLINCISASAQLGYQPTTIRLNNTPVPLYDGSFALLIGISNYTNGLPALMGVSLDMASIKQKLENQGFKVILTLDIDLREMGDAFNSFINSYGQEDNNRLLFYFAGHGYTLKTTLGEELGYIVPVDAPNPAKNQSEFQNKAMEMTQIENYAKRIRSKHALFIFDACFSGSLFATSITLPSPISQKTLLPVRQFITSGTAEEQVPDESIFCQQFIVAIEGDADRDRDGYVTGTELGEFLQKSVTNYSRETQHPQYGKIRNPNLDKGDFIFVVPSADGENYATNPVAKEPARSEQFPDKTANKPPERSAIPGAVNKVNVKPDTRYGELIVLAEYTGDLYIDDVLYQTVVERTQTKLFNIPVGKRRLTFKGTKVFETEIDIQEDKTATVIIRL